MLTTTRTLLALGLVTLVARPLHSQHNSYVLTAEEIANIHGKGGSAFDAVQALRPRWLRARNTYFDGSNRNAPVRSEGAHVYLNDHDQGDAEYLKTIPVELVAELQYLSASEAGARFGPTDGPAIVVTLKK